MTVLSTTLGAIGGVVGLGLVLWPVGIWWEVRKCEKPKYTILQTLGKTRSWLGRSTHAAEVRLYAPYLIAEVVVQGGDMNAALSSGFRQIAGFIFGKNVKAGEESGAEKVAMTSPVRLEMQEGGGRDSEKIAMTSPVVAEMSGSGTFKVSFVMPSKYTLENLPKPLNSNVHIKEVPARTMAAITFSGNSPREAQVESYKRRLLALLAEAGVEAEEGSDVMLYQYDPPFQWGILRTNEVLLPVKLPPGATS